MSVPVRGVMQPAAKGAGLTPKVSKNQKIPSPRREKGKFPQTPSKGKGE